MSLDIFDFYKTKVIHTISGITSGEYYYNLSKCSLEGLILEFGTAKGTSINLLADIVPEKTLYGFDTFEGLPEDWDIGSEIHKTGTYSNQGNVPVVRNNVKLIKGLFQDTLVSWLKDNKDTISFLNIDSDIYSSAIFVLNCLNEFIKPGTIIRFDELCDWNRPPFSYLEEGVRYSTWKEGEWKALNEWVTNFNRQVKPICRNQTVSSTIKVIK